MAMISVPSGQAQQPSAFSKMINDTLEGLGYRVNPAVAPSRGLQTCSSDYLAWTGSFLAGIAVGAVAASEVVDLVQDIRRA